jgi:hypothetical protein
MSLRIARTAWLAALAVGSLSVPVAAQSATSGTWSLEADLGADQVGLNLRRHWLGSTSETGTDVALSQLKGLTHGDLTAPGHAARFELRRDAGTFSFTGRVGDGRGEGSFSFVPDSSYAAELERRGIGRASSADQFKLAVSDIGYQYLDTLRAEKYPQPGIRQLVRMGDHGVDLEFLHGLAAAGYHLGSLDELVRFSDHGVDPDYVAGMQTAGYRGISALELVRLHDHGVDPEYLDGLAKAGFAGADLEAVREAHDHGVSVAYVREFRELGYRDASLRDLARLRDHGVTRTFAERVNHDSSGGPVPIDRLIRMRDRGR